MKKVLLVFGILGLFISCNKEEKKEKEDKPAVIVQDTIKELTKEKPKQPSLIFTVQVGAFKKSNSSLAKLPNVQITNESNLNKYRLGTFLNYEDARKFRRQSLAKYPDAFVQALKNGKPISITKALNSK